MKSAEPLAAFDGAISKVIGRHVPTTFLRSESGDKQWFDASCRRANDAEQTAYRACCRTRDAEHWGQFALLVLRPRGPMVLLGSLIMSAQEIL